jgi:uncharacterized protein YndB with AHSA1/START domain
MMEQATRKHSRQIELPAPTDEVFALLHTPSAIRNWWFANRAIVIAQEGGVWAAVWGEHEDDPDYITVARIETFDPPRRMVLTDQKYYSKSGPLPFKADFRIEFEVLPTKDGSILRVIQDGFPTSSIADEFYNACEKGWYDTFESIRRYLAERTAK